MKENLEGLKIKKVSLTNIRKIIRDKMIESWKIPQFCLETEVNMKKILKVREKFIHLLNPPQLAILGVGGLCKGYKINESEIETYKYIKVTIIADHRALDGAIAAEFLSVFKKICGEEFQKEVLL